MTHQPDIWTGDVRRVLYKRLVQQFGPSDGWKKQTLPAERTRKTLIGFAKFSRMPSALDLHLQSNTRFDLRCQKQKEEVAGDAKRKQQYLTKQLLSKWDLLKTANFQIFMRWDEAQKGKSDISLLKMTSAPRSIFVATTIFS